MGLDPQVFNSEVRRRALEWRINQEEEFRGKAFATLKERVQTETHAYLSRMGILDTKNPVLKNLKVTALQLTTLWHSAEAGLATLFSEVAELSIFWQPV